MLVARVAARVWRLEGDLVAAELALGTDTGLKGSEQAEVVREGVMVPGKQGE